MAERGRQETPAQIERDIDTRRAEVVDTLDALQDRVAPGQWADAAGTLARREGAAVSRAVLRRVRAQPLAAALVAAGLAWLLVTDAPPRPRHRRPHPRRARGRPATAPPV